jgi:holin-like protein
MKNDLPGGIPVALRIFRRHPFHTPQTRSLKQGRDVLPTLTKLLVFQAIGEWLVQALSLPIPGPVVGALLLFIFLILKDGEAAKLAPASSKLLGHLTLLFVPAAVGIMVHMQRVGREWLPIGVALVASTVVSIVVTAAAIRRLRK